MDATAGDRLDHRKANSFYTVNGNRGHIRVVNGPNGPFVRTYADGKWNILLALPECD
jgi:hypothetical protein